jgi:poly-beta-1,6-N-acetyl-D-glucosamine synthase
MHATLVTTLWFAGGIVLYAYVVYPLGVQLMARLRSNRQPLAGDRSSQPASISVVIAVHDEAERILARLDELSALVANCGYPGEIIVVTDGCRDRTAELARTREGSALRVLELSDNFGKAQALSRGCAIARGDVLVFADARQHWADDALRRLLESFSHPQVGAVGGELVIEATPGVLAGVGLYWRYEKWLRRNEARLHSTVGVSGSIAAVRRELFRPIPQGILLDDVYWPLTVVMQGHRVIHDERAIAYDRLPEEPRDEFRRKVRTLSGNFQLMAALPQTLSPLRNPIWVQFVSHKVLRLLVPWLLVAILICSALLDGWVYRVLFWAQVAFYGVALLALSGIVAGTRSRVASTAASFVTLNAAAWLGFWIWATGGSGGAWQKVRYQRASKD